MAIDPTLVYGGEDGYRHKGIRIMGWRQVPGSAF